MFLARARRGQGGVGAGSGAATLGSRDIDYKNEDAEPVSTGLTGLEAQVDIGDFAGIDHDFTAAG